MKHIMKSFAVVLIMAFAFAAFVPGSASAAPSGPSIVDIALAVNADSGEFSTLIAAVVKADLVGTLSANRQFTVFAPTDAAFDAAAAALIGPGSTGMDLVNALDKATLTNVLLYHVAPGERFSDDVLDSSRIRMMNKGFTYVSGLSIVDTNDITSDAGLVLPLVDIDARNGVIHVIDQVLLP